MPVNQAKRKKSASSQPLPPPKRPRSESTSAEDPTRKYCLTKLQELFCQIFLRYPFLEQDATDNAMPSAPLQPQKKPEELTDEDKGLLKAKAAQFGLDLEQCMYELYAEPGEAGKRAVGGKYKYVSSLSCLLYPRADHPRLQGALPDAYV